MSSHIIKPPKKPGKATMSQQPQNPAKSSKSSQGAISSNQASGANLAAYFKGVQTEWSKISWPTIPQIWANLLIVLLMTGVFSSGLWLIDNLFRVIIGLITPAHT